jgi:hypothetical protein
LILPTQVNSANKHGILLEVVQELTDLDLSISKAYIASDGGWFMDGENENLLLHFGNNIKLCWVLECFNFVARAFPT